MQYKMNMYDMFYTYDMLPVTRAISSKTVVSGFKIAFNSQTSLIPRKSIKVSH